MTIGLRAVEVLRKEFDFDPRNCAGVVFAASSLVASRAAGQYLDAEGLRQERVDLAARRFADRLDVPVPARVFGINWGCAGYPRALGIVNRCIVPSVSLRPDQFILVVTVNRTSKIVDYSCKQTAGLFGDMAQATLLARMDSQKYPVHFALLYSAAHARPADGVFFNYHLRENVAVFTPEGGRGCAPRRLVFSLDPMGIGDAAPRAMAAATAKALLATGIAPEDVDFVVPHQAGTSIVRLTAMKLEELGIKAEVVNGMTAQIGNVSSSSVPYALKKLWDRLDGTVLCPAAGVGEPGTAKVAQGFAILRATENPRPPRGPRPAQRLLVRLLDGGAVVAVVVLLLPAVGGRHAERRCGTWPTSR